MKTPIPVSLKIALTTEEAAGLVGMSEGFIKQHIRQKTLRSGTFGRSRRILRKDLDAWAETIVVNSADLDRSPTENSPNQPVEKIVGARP